MEILLAPRGRLNNLYVQPWGSTGWIFADYEVGARASGQRVVIGAQMGAEPWGPQRLRSSGLGGSETAVIRLAEELSNLDHPVTVYCPVDSPGYYNGVCYRDGQQFSPQVRSDMYIAWRMPEAADWDINTRRLILWMHDTDAGDRLTPERAARFDNVVVLTEWHKQHLLKRYEFLDPDKLVVIGNGVDLERFADPIQKDPYKVVYSSSPDRGLDIILEHIWPKVVEQVPKAELHVYYGWNNFDSAAQLPGYEYLLQFKHKVQQLFLDSKNVVQHGRIPQDRLAQELQEATIWLYPTYFTETYCITAIEAQLAGAIPVTNHLAALSETVKSGIIIEGDVRDTNTQLKYVDAVVQLLTRRGTVEHDLKKLVIENAPARSWRSVAESFAKLLVS
jgi:glycosyltransferase involved in cell wall biosynthesis